MIAYLYYSQSRGQMIPCATVARNYEEYRRGDVENLIIAHKDRTSDFGSLDFICENDDLAFSKLKEIVVWLYPGITIVDKIQSSREGIQAVERYAKRTGMDDRKRHHY